MSEQLPFGVGDIVRWTIPVEGVVTKVAELWFEVDHGGEAWSHEWDMVGGFGEGDYASIHGYVLVQKWQEPEPPAGTIIKDHCCGVIWQRLGKTDDGMETWYQPGDTLGQDWAHASENGYTVIYTPPAVDE